MPCQPPLFSSGSFPKPRHSSNKYLWNSAHQKPFYKSITVDSKIIVDKKMFTYLLEWGIQRGVSKGPQGGVGEAKSLGTRENCSHVSTLSLQLCDSRKLLILSELQNFHLWNVDPPSFSWQTWPLCPGYLSRLFTNALLWSPHHSTVRHLGNICCFISSCPSNLYIHLINFGPGPVLGSTWFKEIKR